MRNWRRLTLGAILLFALAMRLKNLAWGFPDFIEDPASIEFLKNFWGVYSGEISFRPKRYDWSPFYYYCIFIAQYLYYLGGRLVGYFADLTALRLEWVFNPGTLYYLGRLLTVFCGLASMLVMYKLGRLFFKSRVVLLGILLFSLDPVFLRYSQVTQSDLFQLFFFLLASYFIVKMYRQGAIVNYLAVGVVIGLGAAAKYTPIILVFPAVLVHIFRTRKENEALISLKLASLLILPPLIFFLILPYAIIDFSLFMHWVRFQLKHLQSGHFTNNPTWFWPGTGIQNVWMHLVVLLSVIFFFRKEKLDNLALFLVNPLLFYIFIIKNATIFDYYLLPIYPFFYLLIANLVVGLSAKASKFVKEEGRRELKGVCILIASVLLIIPAVRADLDYLAMRGEENTASLAREWIEENIQSNTIIISEVWSPQIQTFNSAAKVLHSAAFKEVKPTLVKIMKQRPIYFVHVMKVNVMMPKASAIRYNLDNYRSFPYLIMNNIIAGRYLAKPDEFPVHNKFYADLARDYTEVARFPSSGESETQIVIYHNPDYENNKNVSKAGKIMEQMVLGEYRRDVSMFRSYLSKAR